MHICPCLSVVELWWCCIELLYGHGDSKREWSSFLKANTDVLVILQQADVDTQKACLSEVLNVRTSYPFIFFLLSVVIFMYAVTYYFLDLSEPITILKWKILAIGEHSEHVVAGFLQFPFVISFIFSSLSSVFFSIWIIIFYGCPLIKISKTKRPAVLHV